MKPHKGTIEHYFIESFKKEHYPLLGENLGYVVCGKSHGHPELTGWIRTSAVVKREGKEVETLNSRYTLGKPA